jgi:hypothetical protein
LGRILLILLAGAVLSGCVAIGKALGAKVDLNDKQVDSLTLAAPSNGPLCVDPARGSLLVRASGGEGGDGGTGGFGFGGSGRPGRNNGATGGGGNGGNGGIFFLRVSPEATAYLKLIRFENRGGRGSPPGASGRPGPPPMM